MYMSDTMCEPTKQSNGTKIVKLDDELANETLICGAQHFKATNTTEAVKALCRFAISELDHQNEPQNHSQPPAGGDGITAPNSSTHGGDDSGKPT